MQNPLLGYGGDELICIYIIFIFYFILYLVKIYFIKIKKKRFAFYEIISIVNV